MKFLGLGERFNGEELAFAEDASWFHVLVDEAFHGEDQLVVERGHGFFGKAAHVEFEGIGAATEAADEFSTENGRHAGRKTAVGSESDIALFGLAGEGKFLTDNGVVSAEIGEMAAGFDGSFRQTEVQTIRDGGESRIVAAHKFGNGFFAAGVEGNGTDFLIAGDFVYASRDLAGAFEIAIGECHGLHLRLPRHVERGGRTHHAGTDDQKLQGCTSCEG